MKRYAYLACVFMALWALFASLFTFALNDEIYDAVQRSAGVNEETCALADSERMSLNRDMAMYLAGRLDAIPGVSERAQMHMSDVKALFQAARGAMYVSMAGMLIFLTAAGKRARAHFKRAFWIVFGGFLLLGVAAALMGALDFSAAFTAFHELLFTNDLWLLNPAQDAMIRILPEAFFMKMAICIYIGACAMYLALGALCRCVDAAVRRLNER